MRSWTSTTGLELRDLVPETRRAAWARAGLCPGVGLYQLFRGHVAAHPGRAAVIDRHGGVTYAALHAQVGVIAAVLTDNGLGQGDVIGIRLPNSRDAVAVELAVWAIGAAALPYPDGNGSRNTHSLLGRARATALVTAPGRDIAVAELPHLRVVLAPPPWHSPAPEPCWSPAEDAESPARILVSSGSEAEPKMVAYTHNAFAGGRAAYVRSLHDDTDRPMRNLVLVPLASSMGSCGVPVTIATLGGTLLVAGRFDPATALRMLAEHRPTHVFGVPTMLRRIADLPPTAAPTGLRALVSSGAPLPEGTNRACRARFGVPVITVYGSADGVNCHTATVADGTGTPDPSVAEIRVTDARGVRVPAGEPGEIQALGPMTPWCYVADPALDHRYRTADGWVRTGDRGMLDERGVLHVLGRLKQVVLRGGYNISPAEVEREIGAHPEITDVACLGVPDRDLGERLCACVTQRQGSPPMSLDRLTAFLEGERGLERAKLPELLVVLPALPTTATGKTCRRSLAGIAARAAVAGPHVD